MGRGRDPRLGRCSPTSFDELLLAERGRRHAVPLANGVAGVRFADVMLTSSDVGHGPESLSVRGCQGASRGERVEVVLVGAPQFGTVMEFRDLS